MTTTFRTLADQIAYTLGEPPERIEWAIGYMWPDGSTTYCETRDETEARRDAEDINLGSARLAVSGRVDRSHPVRGFAAYREYRSLPDGTQIINPWTEEVRP